MKKILITLIAILFIANLSAWGFGGVGGGVVFVQKWIKLTEAGLYTDEITEATSGAGITFNSDAYFDKIETATDAGFLNMINHPLSTSSAKEGGSFSVGSNNIASYYGTGNGAGGITASTFEIHGILKIEEFTQYISINAGAASVGATAPSTVTIGTWRGLEFDAAGELAFIEFEVPDDWNGTSDMTLQIYGYAETGDAVANAEIIQFDADYRSVAGGEAYDNGTLVTISPTYTQSGAGTDKAQIELTVVIDYDNANQPLTKNDIVGFVINRDVGGTDTYTGAFTVVKWEIAYTANNFPLHR